MPESLRRVRQRTSSQIERIVPGTLTWQVGYPEHIQRYEFVARQIPVHAKVLDAGCGSGYGAAYLADHAARQVVAVDISREALETARAHFHRPSILWLEDDCHFLAQAAAQAPFDAVCNLENIEHLPEPERFLGRVVDVIRADGVFVTSTPNRILANKFRGEKPDAKPRNVHHFREYTAEEFRTLLTRYFRDVTLHYQTYTAETRSRLYWEPALSLMWYNPYMRLGRWLQRVLRRRPVPRLLDELLPARQLEILPEDPGPDLALVYLAVCRHPIDATANR